MKKMFSLLWTCAVCAATWICAPGSLAQNSGQVDLQFASQETKLIGPSPEAAAMTRYADYPVSYALGQAEVSIPLYEIKSRSLTLPITLQYNTSGVRVDEISGIAGLNWTLHAGGVITRTVAGLPDEYMNGLYCPRSKREAYPYSEEEGQMLSNDYEYLRKAASGDGDREWDLYSYSFPGHTGSFYITHEPYGSDQIVPTSATDLSIRRTGSGFMITDPSGTVWTFTEQETTGRFISVASPGVNAGSSAEMTAQNATTVTSWYLTGVTSMDGRDTLTFSYDTLPSLFHDRHSYSRTYSFTYKYLSPGSYQWLDMYGRWVGPPVAVQNQEASYMTELGWTPHVVKTITFAGGHVTFDYVNDPRSGGSSIRNSYPSVLSSMRVYSDLDTAAVRVVTFSVKGNRTGDQRTLLKQVTVSGHDGTPVETYSFSYISEGTLMFEHAKDLFGYYNGASSNQSTSFLRLFENNTLSETAANRNYNASAVSALSLETITMGSGSKTKFFYEANSIPTNGQSDLFSVIGIGHRIRMIRTFDLSSGSEDLVRERVFTYSGQGITIPLTAFNRRSFVSVSESFREDLLSGHGWWCGPTQPMPRTAVVSLSDQSVLPGASIEGARIFYTDVTERVSGPDGSSVRTDYTYDCSSVVAAYSQGSWTLTQVHDDHDNDSRNNLLDLHQYHFFQRMPYQVPAIHPSDASVDFTPCWFHFVDRDRPEFCQPAQIRRYKTVGDTETLVSLTVNEYTTQTGDVQTGLRVKYLISSGPTAYVRPYRYCALDFFQEEVYRTRVWRRLSRTTQTEYLDGDSTRVLRTDYTYLQDLPGYPDEFPAMGSLLSPLETAITVDGDMDRRYVRRPLYPSLMPADSAWARMLAAEGYNLPVQETVLAGPTGATSTAQRKETWSSFMPADWTAGIDDGTGLETMWKPSRIDILRDGENVGPTVEYTVYDVYGNPLEVNQQGQPTKTYVWGYGGLRPVAEIAGAGYAQVRSALTSSQRQTLDGIAASPVLSSAQISFLRTTLRESFPGAMVFIYAYDGPENSLSMTEDPSGRKTFYEYDGAGRLSAVKDEDGNIMEGYLYELTRGGNGSPNRIISLTYTSGGATVLPAVFSAAMNAQNAIKEVAYLDGLGRSVQGVSVGASTDNRDLAIPVVPDFLDREDGKTYLPYPAETSTSNVGAYRPGAIAAQQAYYNGVYGSPANPTVKSFSENVYEASARNRVTATSLPGFTDRTILSMAGSPADYLPILSFNAQDQAISANGYYGANRFTVSRTEGPDGSMTESWTDEFGTPVLERVRIEAANSSTGYPEKWAETRYIKDIRGRMLCVIPPAEYELLCNQASNNSGIVSSFSAEHCYTYEYDGRDRVIRRHLPDRATETLTYNDADLVLTTTRMAADSVGTEVFSTVYDAFNRPVKEQYQYGNGQVVTLSEYAYDAYPSTMGTGSSAQAVPLFSPVSGIAALADRDDIRMKGLKTAERVRILPAEESESAMAADANAQYIIRSFHYDAKGNVIQTVENRADVGTTVRISTKYGFSGNVLQSRETIQLPPSGGITRLPDHMDKSYSYDARLRPTVQTAQLSPGGISGAQALLRYIYDDLGHTGTLIRGTGAQADTTVYTYTLQGWLSSADGGSYSETLRYASPSRSATDTLPGKAGLITEWTTWQKGSTAYGATTSSNTYAYSYDRAGRLTGSVRYNGESTTPLTTLTEQDITYDPSGNLLTLKRYGDSSGTVPVDDFTFSYTGTKRTGYSYDAHGNVTEDPASGTSLCWNVIGLPKNISDGTDTARRVYAADGTLLAVYDGTTGTVGSLYFGSSIYERKISGVISLESAGWEGGRILPKNGTDNLIYQITDHLGSVRAVRRGNGTVERRFDYYPFGSESRHWEWIDAVQAGGFTPAGTAEIQAGGGFDTDLTFLGARAATGRWRFGGKEFAGQKAGASALAGIPAAAAGRPYLDFGARLYDPRTAAWLSQDPMAEQYYPISPYAYCAGNPVNLVDPTGEDIWDRIIGVLVGYITNILPGSGFVRDWFTPNSRADYNNALQSVDQAAEIVGDVALTVAAVEGGTGAAMAATGSGLVVSVVGTPEGAVVAGAGTALMAESAKLGATGALFKANSKTNQNAGYERGNTNSGETSYTKRGRQAHIDYDPGPGYNKEVRLEPTRKRADAVNYDEGIVKELKPNNPRAIRKGLKQVQEYVKILNKTNPLPDGRSWQGIVDTY